MEEIKKDLKDIKADISEIKVNVAKNTTVLDYHIKRTDLNEARLEKLEYVILGILASAVLAYIKLH